MIGQSGFEWVEPASRQRWKELCEVHGRRARLTSEHPYQIHASLREAFARGVWRASGQHFHESRSQRIDVDRRLQAGPEDRVHHLFYRIITIARWVLGPRFCAHFASGPESQKHEVTALSAEEIGGSHIEMEELGGVQGVESTTDLMSYLPHLFVGEEAILAAELGGDIVAVEVLRHQIVRPVFLENRLDVHESGVVEFLEGAAFRQERVLCHLQTRPRGLRRGDLHVMRASQRKLGEKLGDGNGLVEEHVVGTIGDPAKPPREGHVDAVDTALQSITFGQ